MAHARVYNDYLIERFLPYLGRIRPTCPVPITDVDDAVAEIERIAQAGLGAILLPAIPPKPYCSGSSIGCGRRLRPTALTCSSIAPTGGVKVDDPESTTMKTVARMSREGQPADDREDRL